MPRDIPLPSIDPTVQADIAFDVTSACAVAGVVTEISWAAQWDASRQAITAVQLMGRGSPEWALVVDRELPVPVSENILFLHNHPRGNLYPSETDLSHAKLWAEMGIGFGIVSNDGSRLYLVREPRPRPAPAPGPKTRWAWSLGRWHFSAMLLPKRTATT